MNYAKPISFINKDNISEKVVILGNYISIPDYLPFHKDDESNPVNNNFFGISDFVSNNYNTFLSKMNSDKVVFFETKDEQENMLLATIVKDEKSLKLLSENESPMVRLLVAKNYFPEILNFLSDDENYQVRKEVAKHNIYDISLKLSNDTIFEVLEQIAKHNNKDILLNILNHLPSINSEDISEKYQPNYMQDYVLSEIAKHGYKDLSEKILENKYHNLETIYEISKHNHVKSHHIILDDILQSNPLEYDTILLEISKHDNKYISNRIIDIAEKFPDYQDDPFFSPSLSAMTNSKNKDILLRIASFDAYDINKNLLLNTKDKDVLKLLSNSEYEDVKISALELIKDKKKLKLK